MKDEKKKRNLSLKAIKWYGKKEIEMKKEMFCSVVLLRE